MLKPLKKQNNKERNEEVRKEKNTCSGYISHCKHNSFLERDTKLCRV